MKQLCSDNHMCLFITKFSSLRKKLSACIPILVWEFGLPLLTFLNFDGMGLKRNTSCKTVFQKYHAMLLSKNKAFLPRLDKENKNGTQR